MIQTETLLKGHQAVAQKSAQDILLEQLSQRVANLAGEQKAKESAIKDLNDRMKIADIELKEKLRDTEARYELRRKELETFIEPLEALKQQVPRLQAEIAQLKQQKIDAVSEVRAAKGGAIKEFEARVEKSSARLAKIESAMQLCKEKVAGL